MIRRQFEYGETRRVRVAGVEEAGPHRALVCVDLDDEREAFILLDSAGSAGNRGEIGDEGTITFRRGGPFDGHWAFARRAESWLAGSAGGPP